MVKYRVGHDQLLSHIVLPIFSRYVMIGMPLHFLTHEVGAMPRFCQLFVRYVVVFV